MLNITVYFGVKTSIFDIFSQISGKVLYVSCFTLFNCKWVMIRHHISWGIQKWIILQLVRNKAFILGRKLQFLTLFHRFLEIFYIFLFTHYATKNELWFDITLADTSTKWIIWQFVNNKTFILGKNINFWRFFHRFLEIFYIFLATHYATVNELWFDITLADTSTKWIIWQFVNNKTFILGKNINFWHFFTDFWKYFIFFLLHTMQMWMSYDLTSH